MSAKTEHFVIFLLLSCMPAGVFSQVMETRSAKVSATIVEPVAVSKSLNSEFGNYSLVLTAIVKMTPVGSAVKKGNVVLPVSSGTFTATIYNYTGSPGIMCTYTSPVNPMIIRTGSETMQVASLSPVRNSGNDMIAGVFVSVTRANVIVNYN